MSIYGIRPSNTPNVRPGALPGAPLGTTRTQVPQRTVATPAQAPKNAPEPTSGTSGAVLQPPPGTDPELWSVLSADERAYFAKLGAMGPLTYGRILAGHQPAPAPVARGGRLDVKA
jgi:hypothetical protein